MSGNTTDRIGPKIPIKTLGDLVELLKQSRIEKANDLSLPEAERRKYQTALAGMDEPFTVRPE